MFPAPQPDALRETLQAMDPDEICTEAPLAALYSLRRLRRLVRLRRRSSQPLATLYSLRRLLDS